MSESKTRATDADVTAFLEKVSDERRREDIHLPTLKKLIRKSVTHMRRKYR